MEAATLVDLLLEKDRPRYRQLLTDHKEDPTAALEYLQDYLPDEFPCPDELYLMGEEDGSSDLEPGIVYAIFAESDLYLLRPTRKLERLQEVTQLEPTRSLWTTWG